jgi:phytoene synthase
MTPVDRHSAADIDAAYDYCEAVTRLHAKSFHFAARFLPRRKQRLVFPIYAFCRHVDDEVDEIADGDDAAAASAVERWRARLEDTYASIEAGEASEAEAAPAEDGQSLVFLAWRDLLAKHRIRKEIPLDLIKGVVQDTTVKRYETFEDLYVYCYRVASTVGLMSSEILGYSDASALEYAEAMGIGMQLTNILRDIREDAARGRIYIPAEDLRRFGVSEEEILGGVMGPRMRDLIVFQIERARTYYAKGELGIPMLERDARFTVLLASRIYGKILREIEKLDYDVFSSRAHTTKFQKIASMPSIWLEARRM